MPSARSCFAAARPNRVLAAGLAVTALAIMAAPASAQAVQQVRISGSVAPRCSAAMAPALAGAAMLSQRRVTLHCNGPRPALAVTSRNVTLTTLSAGGRAASYEARLAGGEGSKSGAVEIMVSPAI